MAAPGYGRKSRQNYDSDLTDDWDPMFADYNNPTFNSYTRGPGRKLETQLQLGERRISSKDGFKLYVRNVPANLSSEGFNNIFSKFGRVVSAFVGSKPRGSINVGFVTYASFSEAQTAMTEINNNNPFGFIVDFSEDEETRQTRKFMKQAGQCNYNGKPHPNLPAIRKLGMGRGVSRASTNFSSVGVNPQKIFAQYYEPYYEEVDDNNYENGYFHEYGYSPFDATHNIIQPVIQVDGSGRRVSQGRGYLPGSYNNLERTESCNYKIPLHSKERNEKLWNAIGPYVMEKIQVFENNQKVIAPKDYVRENCTVCKALTNSLCSGCENDFYCSRDCQVKDWPKHKNICKASSSHCEVDDGKIVPNSKTASYSANESHKKQNDRFHSNIGDNKKQSNHRFDKNDSTKPNKFQNKYNQRDNSRSNIYERPANKQEKECDEIDFQAGGDSFTTQPSSPHKTVADTIRESSMLQSSKAESVKSSHSTTSFLPATSTPVSSKTDEISREKLLPANSGQQPSVDKSPTPKKPFFTLNVPVEVVKQYPLSDNDCYVCKKEDISKLNAVFEKLNQVITDSSPSVPTVTLNLKCAAKYENEWFRGKVTSTSPIKVFFVDFGNEEVINDLSGIKVLPEDFRTIAPFAARIFIEGEIKDSNWETDEFVKIIPILKESDKWLVKLPSSTDEKDVKHLEAVDPIIGHSCTTEENSVFDNIEEPIAHVSEEDLNTYKPKELDATLSLFDDVERSWKGPNIVEDISLDSKLLLSVEEINDSLITASAFCKTIPYCVKLIELTVKILPAAPVDPNYRPVCGDMVGALIGDNEWARALVYSMADDGSYTVFLPDKGCKKNDIKEVKKLPGDSALFPHLAVTVHAHSKLNGKLTVGSMFLFSLNSYNDQWIGMIKKVTVDEKTDVISEDDVSTGFLEAWEPQIVEIGRLPCLKLESGMQVIISVGHNVQNIYVKPVTQESVELFDCLAQEIAAFCLSAEPYTSEPRLNELVAAKWEVDNVFYRAFVVWKKKDRFRVIFVDFGNTADIKFEDMRILSPKLKEQPCCAVRIGLKDVPMKPFTASALEYISCLSESETLLTAEFEKLSAVTLLTRDKSVVNDKLCELMVPNWVKAKAEGTDPSEGQVLRRSDLPRNKPLPVNEVITLAALNILPFTGENVQLIMFDPKADVFKHVSSILPNSIEEYCKSLAADDKYVPRTGELCIAKFADDGAHYRAECVKALEYCAEVLFIDYGNLSEVPFQDIHKMPVDLMVCPAMGIFCNLKDVPYSENICKRLAEVVHLGDEYNVKILKRLDEEYDISIPAIADKLQK